MSAYYIGVHLKTENADAVRRTTTALFAEAGFLPLGDEAASFVVEDDDRLPDGEDWYGVIVSGTAGAGWVSVYVADWQDSGAIARGLSARLEVSALELWVAEDIHWGYTLFENGIVQDRFADAPHAVAETPSEADLYRGRAEALVPILQIPIPECDALLRQAQADAGQFAGGGVDALAQTLGLPFGHAFTGYDYFFDDDPDDYAGDLEDWPCFRHLSFQSPPGRDGLVE